MSYGLFALWSQLVENDIQTWWVAKQKILNQPMIMQKILMKCSIIDLTNRALYRFIKRTPLLDFWSNGQLRAAPGSCHQMSLFVCPWSMLIHSCTTCTLHEISLFVPSDRRSWNPHIFSWESQEIHNILNFFHPFLADSEERLKNPPIFPCFNSPSARHFTVWQMFFVLSGKFFSGKYFISALLGSSRYLSSLC